MNRVESPTDDNLLYQLALGVAGAGSENVFESIVNYLAATLGVDLAFVGRVLPTRPSRIQTVAVCLDGHVSGNVEYDLERAPCREVLGHSCYYVREGVETKFFGDEMLSSLHLTGYAGAPLNDSRGQPLGVIAVLHRGPLPDQRRVEAVLSIFAARAATELERLAAEEAMRASEERYHTVFNASVDGIALCSPDGRVVDPNPAFCRLFGSTREALLAAESFQFVHPDNKLRCWQFFEAASAGQSLQSDVLAMRMDGTCFDAEVHGVPVHYGNSPHLLLIIRDITERKNSEKRLRASEEQYRAIFNASADALMLWNSRLQRVDVNPAHEKIFGFQHQEVVGRGFEGLPYPPELARPRIEMVRRALDGEASRAEVEAMRKDGQTIITELRTIPFIHRGEPHVLQIARDITERKRADEERNRLESQLRQAQKMEAIGHLTGGIAHDFNNILTSLMGYLTLVMETLEERGDAKLTRYLERAGQSGQRARDLIQQLLTFSRGQHGEAQPNFLGPLIEEAVELLAASLPSSVVLHTNLEPNLPPVLLDPVQLEQVLMNLCINAADAMRGRGPLHIGLRRADIEGVLCTSCRQDVSGSYVELTVADEGSGIEPDIMERMFEPFFTTKEVGKGSGMGLATVHGIVHKHGGHVAVDSVPGQGTRFRVLFPALQGAAVATSVQCDAGGPSQRAALRGRVLVVDDMPAVAEFMQDLLREWGLEVSVENDPIAARNAFARDLQAYDMAVLDQIMPGLTGLELAQDMLSLRPDLPVVLYTGYKEAMDERAVKAVGVRALIRKPVDADALHGLLHTLLAGVSPGRKHRPRR